MIYKSRGIVRVETVRVDDGNGTIIFVPDNDHSVKNGNGDYAVFVYTKGDNQGHHCLNRGRIVDMNVDEIGVYVTLPADFLANPLAPPLLSFAITTQGKVEITVEFNDVNYSIVLIDIGLPST